MTKPLNFSFICGPIPLKKDSFNKKKPLGQAAQRLFCSLRLLILKHRGDPKKYLWYKENEAHQEGIAVGWNTVAKIKTIPKEGSTLKKVALIYSLHHKIVLSKVVKHVNKRLNRKGYCHGQCITLLKSLLEDPSQKAELLFQKLTKSKYPIGNAQVIEYFREAVVKVTPDDEELYNALMAHYPKPGCYFPFRFKEKTQENTKLCQRFIEVLNLKKEALFILRLSGERNAPHSLFYRSSDKLSDHWFYNSATQGLFSYSSQKDLTDAFFSHIAASYTSAIENKGTLILESYVS